MLPRDDTPSALGDVEEEDEEGLGEVEVGDVE
jgi:hypothetical protein